MTHAEKIAYDRKYRETHRAELRAYESLRKDRPERIRDPKRLLARWNLRRAVRENRIEKPATCQECGVEALLDGHHTDYSKPLEVEWLCRTCHGKRHRKVAA